MAGGEQPRCWTCERTEQDAVLEEAILLERRLRQGMSWDLALESIGWSGTQEDLGQLADLVGVVRTMRG